MNEEPPQDVIVVYSEEDPRDYITEWTLELLDVLAEGCDRGALAALKAQMNIRNGMPYEHSEEYFAGYARACEVLAESIRSSIENIPEITAKRKREDPWQRRDN
jgi:hypothetical protein